MSKTILYARVSTTDQTLEHQRTQAEQAGFVIDEMLADFGVSGVTTKLAERPDGMRLYDKLRRGDTLVVRWVDRLGRNYEDVSDTIRYFMRQGVVVKTVINNMTFDGATTDPMQQAVRDALIAFMAATAQAQAEVTKAAQRAGIDAKKGDAERYRGKKPSFDRKTFQQVIDMVKMGNGASEISKATGLSRQTVLRIKVNPTGADAVLARWGL
jgi:putative DNA-invertase from lambdoid prophage Rac